MFSRKEREKLGSPLPDKWISEVSSLFKDVYGVELSRHSRRFFIAALAYPDELWAAFSLVPHGSGGLPVTYAVSVDLGPQSEPKKVLDSLLDGAGVFFDGYFGADGGESGGYEPDWIEAEHRGRRFFYRVTREDVALSLQAEALLNKAGS